MSASDVIPEPRCSYCLMPVANPGDEFCGDRCKDSSDEYEEQVTVYPVPHLELVP